MIDLSEYTFKEEDLGPLGIAETTVQWLFLVGEITFLLAICVLGDDVVKHAS